MIKLLLIWNWWSPVTSSTRTYTSVAITHILKVRFTGRFSELNWTKRYFLTILSYDLFIDNDESCKSQPYRHVFHELGYNLHTQLFSSRYLGANAPTTGLMISYETWRGTRNIVNCSGMKVKYYILNWESWVIPFTWHRWQTV